MIILVGVIFFRKTNTKTIEKKENETVKLQEIDNNLNSNLLSPEKLNDEIVKKIGEEYYIVKLQYKLQKLDKGKIEAYYSNGKDIIKMTINIEDKKIEKIENCEDEFLTKKLKIVNNLEENVKQDFEDNKSKLNKDNELNIIITDTEIVINIGSM